MQKLKFSLIALATATAATAQPTDIKMFPAPQRGMQRLVITMPPRRDEANWQVEFYAGRMMEVDCNRHSFGQNIEQRDLDGWGYNYWIVLERNAMSTRMGCPPQSRRMAFVTGGSVSRPYNSQLPIIVYAPAAMEVRYRLWSVASREMRAQAR